jgi:hypothetical protein
MQHYKYSPANAIRTHFLTSALGIVFAACAVAQDSTKIRALDLNQDPVIKAGKIATAQGVVDQSGIRFSVKGLTIRQPVIIAVRSDNFTRRLHLELSKYSWDQPERSGETSADGISSFVIKTEGDLNISVKSETGSAGYSLVVWAGDEVLQPIPSPFVPFSSQRRPKTDVEKPPRGSHLGLLWLGLVPILGIFLTVQKNMKLYRTRRSKPRNLVLWIIVLFVGLSLLSNSAAAQKEVLQWFVEKFEWSLKTHQTLEEKLSALQKAVALTKLDASIQENYNPPGAPLMPSHCAETPPEEVIVVPGLPGREKPSRYWDEEGCKKCYDRVVDKLNLARRRLERLRAMGEVNKATYDFAIAAGESMASLPGSGLGWTLARKQIVEGEEVFNQAYDKKYDELLKNLEEALRDVNNCEQKFFNEKDWYERFGFIYYTFMADRYRRK